MVIDAASEPDAGQEALDAVLPLPSLPIGAVTADASVDALPIAPLSPVEMTPVPQVGRLLRIARAAVEVLGHPYPHRAPRPPLTRDEHIAFARNETARLERERQAYRTLALGSPIR